MLFVIIIIILIALAIWGILAYNELVSLRQRVKNEFSQIDIQLQQRFDLIPNLVETVKGYAAHEAETLENVVKMRTAWSNASSIEDKAKIDSEISKAMTSIYAVAEQYPDLKANTNFLELQNELKETEEKIAHARSLYNDIVTKYNTRILMFPTSIIAGMFNFKEETLYKVENDEARKNVKVSFDK